MKYSPEQVMSNVFFVTLSLESVEDRARRYYPAVGAVCPGWGAWIGKPCVAGVPAFCVGSSGTPIEGGHVERITAAREQGAL